MIIFLFLVLTIVPYLVGLLLTRRIQAEYAKSNIFCYAIGMCTMIAIFQLICMLFVFAEWSFGALTYAYSAILLVFSIVSIVLNKERLKEIKIGGHKVNGLMLVAGALIVVQIVTSCVWTPQYAHSGDDTTYITMANDTVETDKIYLTDYITGQPCTLQEVSPKYTLTSFIIYTAYLAKISGLHVLTVCKTILPAVMILLSYFIYGMMGAFLLKGDKDKVAVFLVVLSVLNIFGGFSNYTLTFRLLVCMWQGKALMAMIALPFLFYYVAMVWQEKVGWRQMLLIVIIMLVAASGSLFGLGLTPVMLVVQATVYAVVQRNWKKVIPAILCCIPCGMMLLVYVGYERLASIVG